MDGSFISIANEYRIYERIMAVVPSFDDDDAAAAVISVDTKVVTNEDYNYF